MMNAAEIDAEWEQGEKERKAREARERATKRKANYRKLRPLPRCCATCQFGDINEDCPICYRGAYSFSVEPLGLSVCDHYKRR